jgi:hypothetical protein
MSERQPWELCVVSADEADAYVEYWETGGAERKSLLISPGTPNDSTALRVRRVMAQLAENGWELTGVDGSHFYFKRPKV